jgi:hypothetical protein
MVDWKIVDGGKSYQYSVRLLGLEMRYQRYQMHIDLCERYVFFCHQNVV